MPPEKPRHEDDEPEVPKDVQPEEGHDRSNGEPPADGDK